MRFYGFDNAVCTLFRLQTALEFVNSFKGTNTAEFTFTPERDHTVVTWSMAGKYNLFTEAIELFMSMDKMISGQFERGRRP